MTQTKKILYIEDDPEARTLMADIIQFKGYTYLSAGRGLEGIRLAQQHQPDLILVDLGLPDMQGYEVTTHLKSLPGLKNTPIIALTAEVQGDVREIVLTAGCDGYIAKPINVTEFLFKIEEFLAGKKEIVEPGREKLFLQKYNIQLVSRLKKKITELEDVNADLRKVNQELILSREELAKYNDRLFYLNNLANYLRALRSPNQLIEILPQKIIDGFQIGRCIIFEITTKHRRLLPLSSAGKPLSALRNIKVKLSESFIDTLMYEKGFIWIKEAAEITDKNLLKLVEKLNSNHFILANLNFLGTQNDATSLMQSLSQTEGIDMLDKPSRKLMIFLDKGPEGRTFATYEIRILKSFLQSVAIIYENMMLYSRLIELYKIKSQEAIIDGMTKLYNYRYFVQELQREANRTKRFHTPFSLLMIDIDHFKQYNDRYGHLEGDKILRQMGALFNKNTRTTDTVARYGGEEFAIILPGLKKEEARIIAEKLQHIVEDYSFESVAHAPAAKITISIGLASCPEDSINPQIILQLADNALYQAKRNGRNRVVVNGD